MTLRQLLRRTLATDLPEGRQPTSYYVSGNGAVEVRGEPHYQELLGQLAGRSTDQPRRRELLVDLVREPENQYDRNAVRCFVAGRTIGYIPSTFAPRYSKALAVLETEGQIARCQGVVIGDAAGARRLNVVLRLNEPEKLTVRNQPVGKSWTVLPCGNRRVALLSGERHTDALAVFAKSIELDGGRSFVTLHVVDAGEVIEARLGTAPIGRLTPEMSARFRPVVVTAIRNGCQPWTEARIVQPRRRTDAGFEVWLYLDAPHSAAPSESTDQGVERYLSVV